MKEIDANTTVEKLQQYLKDLGWISNEAIVKIEVPGEGNMNVVLRVITDHRSFILKQSRHFAHKYRQVSAPISRIDTEYNFYKSVSNVDNVFPALIAYEKDHHLLMMEDLGNAQDYSSVYSKRDMDLSHLKKIADVLRGIHETKVFAEYPDNLELRKLNHQHIFVLPFLKENGFNLDEVQIGLQELSLSIKTNIKLKRIAAELGAQYLSNGNFLIHGDYYPGSWMRTDNKVCVLDPEFSFLGYREFDVGVMVGHLILATSDSNFLEKILQLYASEVNDRLVAKIAGIEIIRRLIGLAQLPLDRSLKEKEELLQVAVALIN